jgi:penicillin-binding protein-related factor A (putative recombinase)
MGAKQQAFGDLFEQMFFNYCSRIPRLAITRFPNGCRTVGKNKVIRVKTPWDWVITYGGVTALIDTKTTDGENFPFSKIENHQVEEMIMHEHCGAKSGYIIWFRKSDDIVFVSSNMLITMMTKRGSIATSNGSIRYLGKSGNFDLTMIFGIH